MKPIVTFLALLLFTTAGTALAQPHFGNGIKIGETTANSTIVWLRLTEKPEPHWDGLKWLGVEDRKFDVGALGEKQFPEGATLEEMEGSLSGAPGQVQLSWWPEGQPEAKAQKKWLEVQPERDFTLQVKIEALEPNQRYELELKSRSADDQPGATISASFKTAPGADESAPLRFTVSTCQSWKTRDKGTAGLQIYDHMLALEPAFFLHLGDIVYYDKASAGGDVDARTPELARFHWNRWYGCSDVIKFHRQVPSFFIKDDHDTVTNDSVPGDRVGDLTWDKGLSIFREQAPMSEQTYRTRRWSEHLQFWVVEGRDFRSPNEMPDSPEKSIWGAEQKAWFKETVLASDAPFKILFSPTPVVGPDREKKRDNHSNRNWSYEGDEIRKFLAENNVIVICGDRHWQYHSIDDKTAVHEFSAGATSEAHAGGFKMSLQTDEHQYLAIIGGFLSGEVAGDELTMRHHEVDGSVAYEYRFPAKR